jgi:hypothetical protein
MKTDNPLLKLLDEIDALCAVYIGKNAPSEQWGVTCERFERIDKLRKKARIAAEAK